MVATPTTHYSTFQNRSEQNSDLQRRPRCLRWKHSLCPSSSLSKLMNTCCFSMCVQTEKEGKCLDPSHSHTKATMTPSTTVTRAGLKRSAQASCTRTAMPWMKKTTCTFNITTKEKLSFGASNVSLKNRCHGILLNKMLDINKFPLVLSTLFRTVTE